MLNLNMKMLDKSSSKNIYVILKIVQIVNQMEILKNPQSTVKGSVNYTPSLR